MTATSSNDFTAATYRPLIYGLMLVALATYMICQLKGLSGSLTIGQAMNVFMGCFFIIFAIPKFLNLTTFTAIFRQYDLVSKYIPVYAWLFPFIELFLGISLLSNLLFPSLAVAQICNLVIVTISSLVIIGIGRSLQQKKKLDCACMGARFAFPLSKISLIENSVMLTMSLTMLILMQSDHMVMATVLRSLGIII